MEDGAEPYEGEQSFHRRSSHHLVIHLRDNALTITLDDVALPQDIPVQVSERGIIVQNPPQEFAILFHTLFPEDIVRKAEIGFRLSLLLCCKHRVHLVGDKKRIIFIVAHSK